MKSLSATLLPHLNSAKIHRVFFSYCVCFRNNGPRPLAQSSKRTRGETLVGGPIPISSSGLEESVGPVRLTPGL